MLAIILEDWFLRYNIAREPYFTDEKDTLLILPVNTCLKTYKQPERNTQSGSIKAGNTRSTSGLPKTVPSAVKFGANPITKALSTVWDKITHFIAKVLGTIMGIVTIFLFFEKFKEHAEKIKKTKL